MAAEMPKALTHPFLPRPDPEYLGVGSVSDRLVKKFPELESTVPPQARSLPWLLWLSHWPTTHSRTGVVIGCIAIFAAYVTRAMWTLVFLMLFGMDPTFGATIAFAFYTSLLPMTVFYHLKVLSAPFCMDRLLRELDTDGKHLQRIESAAWRGIWLGFIFWGFSWCISWWLVFAPSAKELSVEYDHGLQRMRLLMWALLPIDFVFGRALEHKAQFFSLYISEVNTLMVASINEFAKGVERILGSPDAEDEGETYEQLHEVECRMRSHVKWVNEAEGAALLAFMAQEGLSAVYTAAVALYTDEPRLILGLLMYSGYQLMMLMRTGLDIARPGDEYSSKVLNLDTPRVLMMLNLKFTGTSGSGAEYFDHLYRVPQGVKIWYKVVRTQTVVRICVTLAMPTALVALRSMETLLNTP